MEIVLYAEHGSARRFEGTRYSGGFAKRDTIAGLIPRLYMYGFRRFIVPTYPGVFSDLTTCANFYDPIRQAMPAGCKLIPGTFLHMIPFGPYGIVPPSIADVDHPLNPAAFILRDSAVMKELRQITVAAQCAVGAGEFYWDCEFVLNHHRDSKAWQIVECFAGMQMFLREFVRDSLRAQTRPLMYHPFLSDMYPATAPRLVESCAGADLMVARPWMPEYEISAVADTARHEAYSIRQSHPGWICKTNAAGGVTIEQFVSAVSALDPALSARCWLFADPVRLAALIESK